MTLPLKYQNSLPKGKDINSKRQTLVSLYMHIKRKKQDRWTGKQRWESIKENKKVRKKKIRSRRRKRPRKKKKGNENKFRILI